jgi:hypothetical protein
VDELTEAIRTDPLLIVEQIRDEPAQPSETEVLRAKNGRLRDSVVTLEGELKSVLRERAQNEDLARAHFATAEQLRAEKAALETEVERLAAENAAIQERLRALQAEQDAGKVLTDPATPAKKPEKAKGQ